MTRDEIISESRAEGGMFIVIPSVVKLDGGLPLSAQMLYGIITWKCNNYAFTWATNRELGDALGVSAKRASALLSLLEQRGHIETEIEYKDGTSEILRRYIYPVMKSARGTARGSPPPKNRDTPPSESGYPSPGMSIPLPENAEVICNINKTKKTINDIPPYSPPEGDAPPAEVKDGVPNEAQHSGADGGSPQGEVRSAPAGGKPNRKARRYKYAPEHKPERFEQFWAYYPGGGSRLRAVSAWDNLAPDDALIDEMARALKRQKDTQQWQEGIGIPHASTWLNQRRWTDKLPEPVRPRDTGGWAGDPER